MDLTKEQYRLLKYIQRNKTIRLDNIPNKKQDCLSKLLECNYVSQYGVGHSGIDFEYYEISINENGKMYIATRRWERIKFLVPTILSIMAIIISFFSLYKSSENIYININTATTESTIKPINP